jgi:hypothetical protein
MIRVVVGSVREGGDVVDLCVLAPRGFVQNRQIAHAAQVIHAFVNQMWRIKDTAALEPAPTMAHQARSIQPD